MIEALAKAISVFPEDISKELAGSTGVVRSECVGRWLAMLGTDVRHLMMQLVPVAATYARAPISKFKVGAVALGLPPRAPALGPGSLYLGANLEFPGEALGFSVHAEQAAVNNAWLHGEGGLQALAISLAPCGHCRQFLYEIATRDSGLEILLRGDNAARHPSYRSRPLPYFLPDAFGPQSLGVQGGLMEPTDHGLRVSATDEVTQAALAGANASYAPYTRQFAGAALKGRSGQIFEGRYAENAAYNPSLAPFASALAHMNMALTAGSELDIREAVLVEVESQISQRNVTIAVLSSVAPKARLRYYRVRP